MDARGIGQERLAEGVRKGNIEMLGDWTVESEKALVF